MLVASTSVVGFNCTQLPPPALGERCHRGLARRREWPNMVKLSFSAFRIFLPRGFSLERDGGARVLLSTPRTEIPSTKGVLEKRGSFEPRRRRGSLSHSRRQLLANAAIASSRVGAQGRAACKKQKAPHVDD